MKARLCTGTSTSTWYRTGTSETKAIKILGAIDERLGRGYDRLKLAKIISLMTTKGTNSRTGTGSKQQAWIIFLDFFKGTKERWDSSNDLPRLRNRKLLA